MGPMSCPENSLIDYWLFRVTSQKNKGLSLRIFIPPRHLIQTGDQNQIQTSVGIEWKVIKFSGIFGLEVYGKNQAGYIRTEIVRLEPKCVWKKLIPRLCNLLSCIHLREVVFSFNLNLVKVSTIWYYRIHCNIHKTFSVFNVYGSVHRKNIVIYIQQDAALHSLTGNCSTCFGWYHQPSSGAQTTVSTASGICHTVTATCRCRGRVGTGLSVLCRLRF
jgi:hypothetical protein